MKNEDITEYKSQPIPEWIVNLLDRDLCDIAYSYGRIFKCHGSGFIPVDEKD